ncbi:AAA family ATPase [Pseudophaeobacter profundi]|uniref:AAA family ATPase n=1 Tax=Pseudophaeobacter profundi TaxID=3034152 RepID=UPI0024305B16|nr:AAA family ATPase [Pseudophaeobacter profundi]
MIEHFDKIENLGVFANYSRPADMAPFEKFNLIYGLNGSGKTTLSRFFADLNAGKAAGFDQLKYKIKTSEGEFKQGVPYTRALRVFNTEYVEANIGQIDGQLNPIYVIGEENKTLAAEIEADEKNLAALKEREGEKKSELRKVELARGKLFSAAAKEIGEAGFGTAARNYNKTKAINAYDKLDSRCILSNEDLALASSSMKQDAKPELQLVELSKLYRNPLNGDEATFFDALEAYKGRTIELLAKSAVSNAIKRLSERPDIARWVEEGQVFHTQKVGEVCEYCQQKVPQKRQDELAAHFNKSDRDLKEKITAALLDLEGFREDIQGIGFENKDLIYPELSEEYAVRIEDVLQERDRVVNYVSTLIDALTGKLTRRNEGYGVELNVFDREQWSGALGGVNSLILQHNSETKAFQKRIDNAFSKIEEHFLSKIHRDVVAANSAIESLSADIKECTEGDSTKAITGTRDLEIRISESRAKLANTHQAAVQMSKDLSSFLGRNDLKFEPEGDGYRIMRFGRAAKRLSEGEKTAITFLYFAMGLRASDFDISEGIVVIDDPISSLDSSSVYQAFSFLKNAVKDAHQVFLLTHNFEFLKLLLNWFQNIPPKKKGKTYWMLHCAHSSETQRETTIQPLDSILKDNKSEFTYLLKVLIEFESDGTIATSYPMPNTVRKVLETFLEQHSTGASLYQLLNNLEYDDTKKAALYKYSNDLSHPTLSGLDPALIGETQTNIKHLLEMIEHIAPVHYKALRDTIAG